MSTALDNCPRPPEAAPSWRAIWQRPLCVTLIYMIFLLNFPQKNFERYVAKASMLEPHLHSFLLNFPKKKFEAWYDGGFKFTPDLFFLLWHKPPSISLSWVYELLAVGFKNLIFLALSLKGDIWWRMFIFRIKTLLINLGNSLKACENWLVAI